MLCLWLVVGCASLEKKGTPLKTQERLQGYLAAERLPDSVALIPAPPTTGSAAFALDEEISRASLPLRNSPRWNLAAQDAELSFPAAPDSFSCALKTRVSEQEAPHLLRLMRRTMSDVSRSVSRAKNVYSRPRPFMANGEPTCTPDYEQRMRKSGSYPSSHAAAGWAWALILSEVAPERGDAVLQRGRAFGQSRIVCNVHWSSDVNEGRTVAAAVVARLHADPVFRADLELARAELAALRAKGVAPERDCAAEADALAHNQ
jgi:acid phosphatase (class A)